MTNDLEQRFASLSPAEASELDRLVVAKKIISAVKCARELMSGLSLSDAERLVSLRLTALGVDLTPPVPTLEDLRTKIRGLDRPPLALEAVWDGDTVFDWFVVLVAIVPDPDSERGMSERWLDRFVSGHGDPAAIASKLGLVLANELAVPFFFASPHDSDDKAPRWWDSPKPSTPSRT